MLAITKKEQELSVNLFEVVSPQKCLDTKNDDPVVARIENDISEDVLSQLHVKNNFVVPGRDQLLSMRMEFQVTSAIVAT